MRWQSRDGQDGGAERGLTLAMGRFVHQHTKCSISRSKNLVTDCGSKRLDQHSAALQLSVRSYARHSEANLRRSVCYNMLPDWQCRIPDLAPLLVSVSQEVLISVERLEMCFQLSWKKSPETPPVGFYPGCAVRWGLRMLPFHTIQSRERNTLQTFLWKCTLRGKPLLTGGSGKSTL